MPAVSSDSTFSFQRQTVSLTADSPLSPNVQREMLLGKCWSATGGLCLQRLISPGWRDHGTEEDLYDQSCLIKEEAHSLSGVICIHCSDVKCLPLKGDRALSLSPVPSIIPPFELSQR